MEVAGSDGEGRRALSPPRGALPAYQVSLKVSQTFSWGRLL